MNYDLLLSFRLIGLTFQLLWFSYRVFSMCASLSFVGVVVCIYSTSSCARLPKIPIIPTQKKKPSAQKT